MVSNENEKSYADGHLMIDLKRRQVYVRGVKGALDADRVQAAGQCCWRMLAASSRSANCLSKSGDCKSTRRRFVPSALRTSASCGAKNRASDPANPIYILTEHRAGYRFEKQPNGRAEERLWHSAESLLILSTAAILLSLMMLTLILWQDLVQRQQPHLRAVCRPDGSCGSAAC